MRKRNLWGTIAAAIAITISATGCSEENDGQQNGPDTTTGNNSKYVIAGTSSDATYLMTTDKLNEGVLSSINNGFETASSTTWVFYKEKYAYRLVYNQGNAGITTSYQLNADGKIEERNMQLNISDRFTTNGIYGDYIIMAASGATDRKDDNGNPQYGITFTMINANTQAKTTKTVPGENLLGTGEYCTISGILESQGKIYTAVCPEGVSVYGVQNNGDLLSEEAKALINAEGGISGTVNPNHCWVAIYDGMDFDHPKIIKTDKISYATSRYRSQYYQTIDTDDTGNVYVFSSSYATAQSGIQKTALPSGVVRIKAGTEEFDSNYYVNLEDESVAGRAMYKVWHITGDYFLLQMYKDKTDDKSYKTNTHKLGIFKAEDKKFTWVDGLPEATEISSLSKNAYAENGLAYIAVTPTTDGAKPTIYVIDPITAKATPGLVITADGVGAVGKLTY